MLSRDTVCYINLNTGSSDAEKGFMDKAELDRALSGGEAGTEIQITEEEYLLQLIKWATENYTLKKAWKNIKKELKLLKSILPDLT